MSTSGLLQEARERDPGAHRSLAAAILSVQYMLQCLASHMGENRPAWPQCEAFARIPARREHNVSDLAAPPAEFKIILHYIPKVTIITL